MDCYYCKQPIEDPDGYDIWMGSSCWTRRQHIRASGQIRSMSDRVVAKHHPDRLAHGECVRKAQRGLTGQMSLGGGR